MEVEESFGESPPSSLRGELKSECDESEKMRQELSQYLNDFRDKRGEDGRPLVHFPQNFDSISEAMSRKDLVSTEENSWSKYLFQERFDKDVESETFEGGRYRDVIAETKSESALHRGLAEIHMLDKQLFKVSKKARDIQKETDDAEAMLTGRSDATSRDGKMDGTFLTRLGGVHSAPGSVVDDPINSARSDKSTAAKKAPKKKRAGTASDNSQATGPLEVSAEGGEEDGDQEDAAEKNEVTQMRVNAILEGEDLEDSEVWKAICRYGYSAEDLTHINQIDSKLASFEEERKRKLHGHVSENSDQDLSELPPSPSRGVSLPAIGKGDASTPPPPPKKNDEEAKTTAPPDYLKEQRVANVRKRYAAQIDSMLRLMTAQDVDLSGLILPPSPPSPPATPSDGFLPPIHSPSRTQREEEDDKDDFSGSPRRREEGNSGSRTGSKSGSRSGRQSIYAVPSVESIIPNRPITASEVGSIVDELCYAATESDGVQKAGRAELDRLLSGCRDDVARLRELRHQRPFSAAAEMYSFGHMPSRGAEGVSETKAYEERVREYYREMDALAREKELNTIDDENDIKGGKSGLSMGMDESQITEELRKFTASLGIGGFGSSTSRPGSGGGGGGRMTRMTALQMKEAREGSSPTSTRYGLGALLDRRGSGSADAQTSDEGSSSVTPRPTAAMAVDMEAYQSKMNAVLDRASHACDDMPENMGEGGNYADEEDAGAADEEEYGEGAEVISYDRYTYELGVDSSALEQSDGEEGGECDHDDDIREKGVVGGEAEEKTHRSKPSQQPTRKVF